MQNHNWKVACNIPTAIPKRKQKIVSFVLVMADLFVTKRMGQWNIAETIAQIPFLTEQEMLTYSASSWELQT
jgi:hypothetical protein